MTRMMLGLLLGGTLFAPTTWAQSTPPWTNALGPRPALPETTLAQSQAQATLRTTRNSLGHAPGFLLPISIMTAFVALNFGYWQRQKLSRLPQRQLARIDGRTETTTQD